MVFLQNYVFFALLLVKALCLLISHENITPFKLAILDLSIILVPVIIMIFENRIDYAVLAVVFAITIIDVVFYRVPGMYVFWVFIATILIGYLLVVFGIVDYLKWSFIRDSLLGLIMASSFGYIRLSKLASITMREVVIALIIITFIVILGKLTGKIAGVEPPMPASEILLRMGKAMVFPFLETVLFSVLMLYLYGETTKGCILTIIMSVLFSFFHTRFYDFWYSMYFIVTNSLFAFAYYLTKNVSLTIGIHYTVNIYIYSEMIIKGMVHKGP